MYAAHSNQKPEIVATVLLQQSETPADLANLCLADFVAPRDSRVPDYVGAFAVTTGIGVDAGVKAFEADHDDYSAIMLKALADRLAEAFTELLHERVRKEYWGYAAGERLSSTEVIPNKYPPIPPPPPYPPLPNPPHKE